MGFENGFEGRVSLITGGASGIGLAAATRLVKERSQVVIADLDESRGKDAASQIGAEFVRLDVSDPANWREAVAAVQRSVAAAARRDLLGRVLGQSVVSEPAAASLAELMRLEVGTGGDQLADLATPAIRDSSSGLRLRVNGREGLFLIVYDDPTALRRDALAETRRRALDWAAGRPGVRAGA